jgi:multidrug efflux system membrane fusion protein
VLVVLILGILACYHWYPVIASVLVGGSKAPTTQPDRSLPVAAAQARSGDLPIYLDGLGSVTPLNTVTVHTRVDGQIMKVHYTEGQMVQQGAPLVEIDPRPYEDQLTQAEGQLTKDQAALKNAELDVARYTLAGDAATQQQLDTAVATRDQLKGAITVDQGQIESIKLNLTYCHITAPFAGRVGLRLVDEGNIVHATDTGGLLVITQVQPITVIFTLSQDTLPQVQRARRVTPDLPVQANDSISTKYLTTGSLLAIDNTIDPTTLKYKLRAQFANADDALYPNQAVNVRMLVDTLHDIVLVPAAAVQRSPTSDFVYVVKWVDSPKKDRGTVDVRNVVTGPVEGEVASVKQGLAAGETVVTDGTDKLLPGGKVVIRNKETPPPQTAPAAQGAAAAPPASGPAGNP